MQIYREFFPTNPEKPETSGGTLALRFESYDKTLPYFEKLVSRIISDSLEAVPPLEVDSSDVNIEKYSGDRFRRMYGVEVHLPEGHRPPENYMVFDATVKEEGVIRAAMPIAERLPISTE